MDKSDRSTATQDGHGRSSSSRPSYAPRLGTGRRVERVGSTAVPACWPSRSGPGPYRACTAISQLDADPATSFLVGDSPSDVPAAYPTDVAVIVWRTSRQGWRLTHAAADAVTLAYPRSARHFAPHHASHCRIEPDSDQGGAARRCPPPGSG